MGFIRLLPAKTWAGIGGVVVIALLFVAAYRAIYSSGVGACEGDAALVAIHAQEAAHQEHLAAIERGEEISRRLLETQRKLRSTEREYLAYANAIVGNCPDTVRVLAHYAARGEKLPETTSAPPGSAATVSADAVGQNIAENYARCFANAAQHRALIEWHNSQAVK